MVHFTFQIPILVIISFLFAGMALDRTQTKDLPVIVRALLGSQSANFDIFARGLYGRLREVKNWVDEGQITFHALLCNDHEDLEISGPANTELSLVYFSQDCTTDVNLDVSHMSG